MLPVCQPSPTSFAISLPSVHRASVLTDGLSPPFFTAKEQSHGPVGRRTRMVDMLTIAAAAAWLLVFGLFVLATGRPALRAGTTDPRRRLAPEKPALVNLSVTRCRLNGAAYPATILDLAARGYLAISGRAPGRLWCYMPASAPVEAGLVRSERLVLAGVRALAAGHGAPFEALAESCATDVRGRWDPFERAVRAEGRRAGITRARLPVRARVLLYGGAAGVGALAFAAVHGLPGAGLWAPAATALVAFAVPAYLVHALGRPDRLTAHGSAVGAWAVRVAGEVAAFAGPAGTGQAAGLMAASSQAGARQAAGLIAASSPAGLHQLATAVAVGAPVPIPG